MMVFEQPHYGTSDAAGRSTPTILSGKIRPSRVRSQRKSTLGFLGVLAGIRGMQDVLRSVTNTAALGRAATNIGIPVAQLSRWQLAAQRYAGGSAEATAGSINGLEQQVQQFRVTGQMSPALVALARLGGSPYASMQSNLLTLAHAFHHMSPAAALKFGSILGLDTGTINLLEQGRAAVAAHLRAVSPDAVTRAQTQAMIKLQTAFAGVTQAAESLGRVLLADIAPGLTRMAHIMRDVLEGNWSQLNKDLHPPGYKSASAAAAANRAALNPQGWANTPEGRFLQSFFMNNNPGNIRHRNANGTWSLNSYPSRRAGMRAMSTLLESYPKRYGADTVASIIPIWNGHGKNDPAYIKNVSNWTGYGPNQPLNLRDPMVRDNLMAAMIRQEHGKRTSPFQVQALLSARRPGLSPRVNDTLNLLRGAQMARLSIMHAETTHAETHIGHVTINTQSRDPHRVAAAIRSIGTPSAHAMQANTGLN